MSNDETFCEEHQAIKAFEEEGLPTLQSENSIKSISAIIPRFD
jgi:hypothetical protein